jgi:hypothetical protein
MLASIATGLLVHRFGSRGVFLVISTGLVITMIVLALKTETMSNMPDDSERLLVIALYGLAAALFSAAIAGMYAVMTYAYPSACRSAGIGFGIFVARVGAIAGSGLGGKLIDLGEGSLLPYFGTLIAAVGAGVRRSAHRRPSRSAGAEAPALAHARTAKRQRRGRPAGAARKLRLVGSTAVRDAVREAGVHLVAAEVEVRLARMPHRPAAHAVVEVEQAGLVGHSALGLAGTKRRGGAGGSAPAGRRVPGAGTRPDPTDTTRGMSCTGLGNGWLGVAGRGSDFTSAKSSSSSSRSGSGALALGLGAVLASASFRGVGLGSLALTGEGVP